ncbi:RING/U-box superfamily protein [Tripterygium wilfordii]|uniref:RING/U-box superfamily protein n=1 Tax=Tripterygium wilfordii TaxID=458696 RepID=A0A7J7D7V5_TRIWF|nr:RING/U-box superfamily protein [Tripterygium wilfordii]
MASSQVEYVSSAPFGCVLRDHKRRERCGRESAAAAFEKNLKQLVHNCISVYPDSSNDDNSRQNRNMSISNKIEKTEENPIGSRHARILDRWRQAREMVSNNIETRRTQEAESTGAQNLGASSLVQMWEARLHRSNIIKRPSSGTEEPSRTHETFDSADERLETRTNNDESLTEWESQSDRTAQSEPPTLLQSRSSDAGESERVVRIADIIRRLADRKDNEQHSISACNSPSRWLSSGSDQTEVRGALTQIVCSPKIRGRQAFNDLLIQMERDRQQELCTLGERQVVSRFTQRGRIQSMLRLRFLQRGMAIQDQLRTKTQASPQLSRLKQGSGIVYLRERFNGAVEQGMTARSGTATPKSPDRETINSLENAPTCKRLSKDSQPHDVSASEQQGKASEEYSLSILKRLSEDSRPDDVSASVQPGTAPEEHSVSWRSEISKALHEVAGPSSDVEWQETSVEYGILTSQGRAETTGSLNESNDTEVEEEQEADEPLEFLDSTYDWFSDIARPRSFWEDRRQAWYEEMLSSSSENEEIRRLLERRTVSSFLSSDFRDRMDQLMTCHAQRQMDTMGNQEDEDDNDYSRERMHQLMLAIQRHTQQVDSQEGGEDNDDYNDENEAGVQMQEQEAGREARGQEEAEGLSEEEDEEGEGGIDEVEEQREELESSQSLQMHFPSPFRSWSDRSHEISDDSDQAASISSQQHPQFLSYNQQNQRCSSSTNHPLLEMELICNLRGHMVQMQREMLELRKSIQSCMEMQMQCQNSMKQEVHSVQGEANNSLDRALKNRRCCICYEMQVDSLLYRCGHMCTCLKCAHELQWSSGKCPVCRAPIDDVVRAFLD